MVLWPNPIPPMSRRLSRLLLRVPPWRRRWVSRAFAISLAFREIVTPLTQVHFRLDGWIRWCAGGQTVIDATIPYLLRCSPRFARLAEAEARDSSVIIISHPWVYPYVPRRPDQLLIYDAHNC